MGASSQARRPNQRERRAVPAAARRCLRCKGDTYKVSSGANVLALTTIRLLASICLPVLMTSERGDLEGLAGMDQVRVRDLVTSRSWVLRAGADELPPVTSEKSGGGPLGLKLDAVLGGSALTTERTQPRAA